MLAASTRDCLVGGVGFHGFKVLVKCLGLWRSKEGSVLRGMLKSRDPSN